MDNSLHLWRPAKSGCGLSPGYGKLSSTADPLTSDPENAPPDLNTSCKFPQLCLHLRLYKRKKDGLIMLIAFDRGTESDYSVTLYCVSEKKLAGLPLQISSGFVKAKSNLF